MGEWKARNNQDNFKGDVEEEIEECFIHPTRFKTYKVIIKTVNIGTRLDKQTE